MKEEKLDERLSKLFNLLVPGSGRCDTVEGEMLRAINKIIYRFYNDGDMYFEGYGCETAGPPHSYLVNVSPLKTQLRLIFEAHVFEPSKYEDVIYQALEVILDFVDGSFGIHEINTVDMLDSSPEYMDEDDENGSCWECGRSEWDCICDDEDY